MKKFFSLLSFIAVFLFITSSVFAFQLTGIVTRVLDGDTFHFLPDGSVPQGVKVHKDRTISVRMRGIDAPEKRQAYGEEARLSLKELIGGKKVKLDVKDVDQYGRAVAYVFVNNINVNLEQVKRGMAWAYTEYLDRPYASEFYEAEKQARQKKLGLWEQANPTPPWEWRKRNR
ncbi:thermonuclease family protein [Thermodesulfovibrio yellowstonii]|uniref:thermonuclease family protein n=1 Tax=Thermodesulfovibrio yellowstonii TaxID=28262 RepID=UPI00040531A4|nr:thermonuclease family protein [Thermodesulfovibrio islandicus]